VNSRDRLTELKQGILLLLSEESLLNQLGWSRVADLKSYVEHGEYGVAIEDLCAALYEAPGPFGTELIARLEEIVLSLDLKEEYLKIIRNLRRKGGGVKM
jgi:hypothetical protein